MSTKIPSRKIISNKKGSSKIMDNYAKQSSGTSFGYKVEVRAKEGSCLVQTIYEANKDPYILTENWSEIPETLYNLNIPNNIYPDFPSYQELLTEECAMALGWIFMAHIGKYSSLKAEFRLIQIKVVYTEVICSSGVIKDQSGNSTILETKKDSTIYYD